MYVVRLVSSRFVWWYIHIFETIYHILFVFLSLQVFCTAITHVNRGYVHNVYKVQIEYIPDSTKCSRPASTRGKCQKYSVDRFLPAGHLPMTDPPITAAQKSWFPLNESLFLPVRFLPFSSFPSDLRPFSPTRTRPPGLNGLCISVKLRISLIVCIFWGVYYLESDSIIPIIIFLEWTWFFWYSRFIKYSDQSFVSDPCVQQGLESRRVVWKLKPWLNWRKAVGAKTPESRCWITLSHDPITQIWQSRLFLFSSKVISRVANLSCTGTNYKILTVHPCYN